MEERTWGGIHTNTWVDHTVSPRSDASRSNISPRLSDFGTGPLGPLWRLDWGATDLHWGHCGGLLFCPLCRQPCPPFSQVRAPAGPQKLLGEKHLKPLGRGRNESTTGSRRQNSFFFFFGILEPLCIRACPFPAASSKQVSKHGDWVDLTRSPINLSAGSLWTRVESICCMFAILNRCVFVPAPSQRRHPNKSPNTGPTGVCVSACGQCGVCPPFGMSEVFT